MEGVDTNPQIMGIGTRAHRVIHHFDEASDVTGVPDWRLTARVVVPFRLPHLGCGVCRGTGEAMYRLHGRVDNVVAAGGRVVDIIETPEYADNAVTLGVTANREINAAA